MQKIQNNIISSLRHIYSSLSVYMCWFLENSKDFLEKILGKQNATLIKHYMAQHSYFCIGGTVFILWGAYNLTKKLRSSTQQIETNKKQKKPESNKLPEKYKPKLVFISQEQDNEEEQINQTKKIPHDTTCDSRPNRQRNNKESLYSQDFEAILDREVDDMQEGRIILQDSRSDKIFNQMYGMYQAAL